VGGEQSLTDSAIARRCGIGETLKRKKLAATEAEEREGPRNRRAPSGSVRIEKRGGGGGIGEIPEGKLIAKFQGRIWVTGDN
jgi:hypothetical protein